MINDLPSISYNMVSSISSMFLTVLAYLLLLFAVILVTTIFIMIRHRIANNIEEQMMNRRYEKQSSDSASSQEERIKARAQAKIASLMSSYGIDSMDYAIMVDGKIIKGSSKNFAISNITDMDDMFKRT